MTNVLAQRLDPPVRAGEDAAVAVAGTFAANPAAWATRFSMRLAVGDVPAAVTPAAPDVSGPAAGLYAATWAVTVPAATTAGLAPGVYAWELARTDDGSHTVLAAGTWAVLPSVTGY